MPCVTCPLLAFDEPGAVDQHDHCDSAREDLIPVVHAVEPSDKS